MTDLARRRILESFGAVMTGAVGMGVGHESTIRANVVDPSDAWEWRSLESDAVAHRAYALYPDGSCMYAVFGSVITLLAEKYGAPFSGFPITMMRYGAEGAFYGSLCGAANAAAALIGLFYPSMEQKGIREKMIQELFAWYERSEFPNWSPLKTDFEGVLPRSVSGSVLCHISMGHWCRESGKGVASADRKERCRRLSAEVAARVTELLNHASDPARQFASLPTETTGCTGCHSPKGPQPDSATSMRCDACHVMRKDHPNKFE